MMSTVVFRLLYAFSIIQVAYQTIYSCDPDAPCGCSQFSVITNARIVDGEDARSNTLSWTVSLELGDYLCGGTIIHESFVVTAAHCVDHNFSPSDITVFAGSLNINGGIRKSVSRIYSHPAYNKNTNQNDIALLRLTVPLDLSSVNLAKICLPNVTSTLREYPPASTSLVTAGWGTIWSDGPISSTLQQVTVQVVGAGTSYCQNIIKDPLVQFCAGTMPQGGKDTCQGDSGGPLMMFNSNKQWELVGVVSYGRGCGLPNYPGVYTRVVSYTKWINDIIQGSLPIITTTTTPKPTTSTGKIPTTSVTPTVSNKPTTAGLNNSANSINISIYFLFSILLFLFN